MSRSSRDGTGARLARNLHERGVGVLRQLTWQEEQLGRREALPVVALAVDERRAVAVEPLVGAHGDGDLQLAVAGATAHADALHVKGALIVEHLILIGPPPLLWVEVEAVLAVRGQGLLEVGHLEVLGIQVGVVGVGDGLPRAAVDVGEQRASLEHEQVLVLLVSGEVPHCGALGDQHQQLRTEVSEWRRARAIYGRSLRSSSVIRRSRRACSRRRRIRVHRARPGLRHSWLARSGSSAAAPHRARAVCGGLRRPLGRFEFPACELL